MAELKTRPTRVNVSTFLDRVTDPETRRDCLALVRLMTRVIGEKPRMWGKGMVGFGTYHYVYASGREGDWPVSGFSPRKRDLTVYLMAGCERFPDLLAKLGKHRTGKSCLYLRRLADVDMKVLEKLVAASVRQVRRGQG